MSSALPPPALRLDLLPNRPLDFERAETLFDRVAHLAPAGRQLAVESECRDRPDLARMLEGLLAAHDRLRHADAQSPGIGSRVGAYRLVERIGAGGMGEVYRAERDDGSFAQTVAVKLTRAALVPGDTRRRFDRERQILASLDHPHIVRLLDGGATPDGHAYFVMELVAGVPITQYCSDRELPLAQRARLMRDVCAAVQHAHRHGVVHRDLKPANILVTADGIPKVLDFGVAKIVAGERDAALETRWLHAPLTASYASPEQLLGRSVTAAADVYALGVLLYELASGTRPYETDGEPLDRVLDTVVQRTPVRPSAARAPAGLPYSTRALRGDFDAIVLNALHKEPVLRYGSAGELAADLTRWLERQPVVARRASAAYVLRRFAARHRPLVTVAAFALVAIVAAAVIAWGQFTAARVEQARSDQRFDEVRAMAKRVLDYQGALSGLGGAAGLRERMIADSLRALDALAAGGPATPELDLEIARAYAEIASVQGAVRSNNLGDRASAVASLRKAEALLEKLVARAPSLRAAAIARAELPCRFSQVEPARAAEHAARCVAALGPLAAEQPSDDALRLLLGRAHVRLAETGSADNAREAIALLSRPMHEPRDAESALAFRAYAHRLLGWHLFDSGAMREALEHGEASAADLAAISDPNATHERRMDRSFTLQLIGRSSSALGDALRARESLEAALRLVEHSLRDSPGDAFIEDRLVRAYRHLTIAHEETGDREAAARVYREAVERLPSLTTTLAALAEPSRDAIRGELYAGHASLSFATPPCDLLQLADAHFRAAREPGALAEALASRAAWVASSLRSCGAAADDAGR